MRDYNSETDFHLIEEAKKEFGCTLSGVARVLMGNIIWPSNFNRDRRPHVVQLDKDILKVWEKK